MDRNRFKILEAKYWKGESSLAEEQELRRYVLANKDKVSKALWDLFVAVDEIKEARLDDDFDTAFWNSVSKRSNGRSGNFHSFHFMRYAATGIIILGLAIGFFAIIDATDEPENTVAITESEDTYSDPEQAFEETKKALFFASEKLNKGIEPASEIKRFHNSKMSITGVSNCKSAKKE